MTNVQFFVLLWLCKTNPTEGVAMSMSKQEQQALKVVDDLITRTEKCERRILAMGEIGGLTAGMALVGPDSILFSVALPIGIFDANLN